MDATQPARAAWHDGDAYERYMGRWSRKVAPRFLEWLGAPRGLRWLDLGCGTGALSTAILDRAAPHALVGVDPSPGFLARARRHLPASVSLREGRADAIALDTATVDVAVAGLVLNFAPDAVAALREMARVTVPGGTVAVYVWDYAKKMEMIRCYWEAAVHCDPAAATQVQGERFPLCEPAALAAAAAAAGLEAMQGGVIGITMHFRDFDDYWQPFLGGQGPAPAHAMRLDAGTRARVRERLRETLPQYCDGSIALPARVLALRARVPR